jgi:hypothetical protein
MIKNNQLKSNKLSQEISKMIKFMDSELQLRVKEEDMMDFLSTEKNKV